MEQFKTYKEAVDFIKGAMNGDLESFIKAEIAYAVYCAFDAETIEKRGFEDLCEALRATYEERDDLDLNECARNACERIRYWGRLVESVEAFDIFFDEPELDYKEDELAEALESYKEDPNSVTEGEYNALEEQGLI